MDGIARHDDPAREESEDGSSVVTPMLKLVMVLREERKFRENTSRENDCVHLFGLFNEYIYIRK